MPDEPTTTPAPPTDDEVRAALHDYLAQGWAPVPIEPRTKASRLKGWPDLRIGQFDAVEDFEDLFVGKGVGLLLGRASGGLVDVDLDCLEAAAIASAALDRTLVSGRPGARGSHYWYVVSGDVRTERFLDPVAMERDGGSVAERTVLLEIRADGAQTVVAPSLHPSGERYRWEGDTPVARVPAVTLRRDVVLIAAAALLARYWPGHGSRHAAAVALCGALAGNNPEWWDEDTLAGFVNAVVLVGGDDEVHDRLAAVRTTHRRLRAGGAVQGWPTLADLYERKEASQAVWQAKEWIDEVVGVVERSDATGGTTADVRAPSSTDIDVSDLDTEIDAALSDEPVRLLQSVDLVAALDAGVEEIRWVVPGLLVEGQIHTIAGYPGVGKSLLALWACDEAVRLHRAPVMYIDEENGLAETIRRLESLHVDRNRLGRIHYYPFPGLDLTNAEHLAALFNEVEAVSPSLIVVDSMIDLLVNARLRQNEDDDVGTLYKSVLEPLRNSGRTVLLLDHLAKHDPNWTKGAGAKDGLVQVTWTVAKGDPFDRSTAGSFHLNRQKDRTGALPLSRTLYVTPSERGTVLKLSPWPEEVVDDL